LNIFAILDQTHPGNGQYLVRVHFDVTFGNDVPKKLSSGDSEDAFFQVQLTVESSKVVEGFFQIRDEVAAFLRLYHDVIIVNLKVMPNLFFEAKLHTLLICSPAFFSLNDIFM
jgi:hypothetical protein